VKKKIDELIYELIFSENTYYLIDISDYLNDIYKHEHFIDELRHILKKARVKIIKGEIKIDSKTVIWELKVKK
jgi:hypothetical protein